MSTRTEEKLTALLRCSEAPSDSQRDRLLAFLKERYGDNVTGLDWEKDDTLRGGFRLQVGADIYDWSREGLLRRFKDYLRDRKLGDGELIPLMREVIDDFEPDTDPEELGTVISVGDEIAEVRGLEHAAYGEILQFRSGIKGMVPDLKRDRIGCILFGDTSQISEGSVVRRTRRTAGMPVGEGFLGRVVDALGQPIDGKAPIEPEGYRPIEMAAPGILQRQPVDTPMETGLVAIDSMFPMTDRQDGHSHRYHTQPEG